MIKFNKFNVTNGTAKAKVSYSLDNRTDGRACVTLYSKDYSNALGTMFNAEYSNGTDLMTDYFEKGKVVLFADHPLYKAARARAEANVVPSNWQWNGLSQGAPYTQTHISEKRAAWYVKHYGGTAQPMAEA